MSSTGSFGCADSMVVNEVAAATERESHIMSKRHFRVNSAAVLVLFGGVACLNVGCSSEAGDCSETATCNGATTQEGAASASDAAAGVDGGRDAGSGPAKVTAEAGTGVPLADGASTSDVRDSGFDGCLAASTPDLPDDDFKDTNCDGIDGDKARAIFVAPSGDDGAAGTIEAPVKTLSTAIVLATAAQKDVYVCNATYAENVTIAANAVRLYGGYDCANGWARRTDHATIAPPSGVALAVREVAVGHVAIDRIDVRAANATEPGESSIAGFIVNSSDVALTHVSFEAGLGADGKAGAPPLAPASAPVAAADGAGLSPVVCTAVGVVVPSVSCSTVAWGGSGMSGGYCEFGGAGGKGANLDESQPQEPGSSGGVPVGPYGVSGLVGGAAGGAVGHPGIPGSAAAGRGDTGNPADAAFGSVTTAGYVASNAGAVGSQGPPGQAGGGGSGGASGCCGNTTDFCFAGGAFAGGGGGQGGHGGCGGAGGKAGGGGGASIALLVVGSRVQGRWLSLKAGDGGRGGNPSAGAAGQPGGQPGNAGTGTRCGSASGTQGNGFAGGAGGRGGAGGPGGPGGGGPSVALVSSGPVPMLSNTTFETGVGGPGGSALSGPNGAEGLAQDQYLLNADAGTGADAGSSR